jgi:hypothetical protein
MKLSTNYKIETKVSHVSYDSGDESLTIYSEDDEMLEVYGVDFGTILCFTRNLLVVDAKRHTFTKHQIDSLREIKDALTNYLGDKDEATK